MVVSLRMFIENTRVVQRVFTRFGELRRDQFSSYSRGYNESARGEGGGGAWEPPILAKVGRPDDQKRSSQKILRRGCHKRYEGGIFLRKMPKIGILSEKSRFFLPFGLFILAEKYQGDLRTSKYLGKGWPFVGNLPLLFHNVPFINLL